MDFQNLTKINIFGDNLFLLWALSILPWDHMRTHKKIGPERFCRFYVYWIPKKNLVFFIWKRTFFINSFLNYFKIQGNFIRKTKTGVYFEELIIFKFEKGGGVISCLFSLFTPSFYTSETKDFREGRGGGQFCRTIFTLQWLTFCNNNLLISTECEKPEVVSFLISPGLLNDTA